MRQEGVKTEQQLKPKEGEEEKKVEYSAEQREVLDHWQHRLEAVAHSLTGDKSMGVYPGEAGTRLWYYRMDTNNAYFDPEEVLERHQQEGGPEVLLGSMAHEAGHGLISDFSFIPQDLIKDHFGLMGLMRSVEERPTDQVVRDRQSGAGEWVDRMREALGREDKDNTTTQERLGYTPHFFELSNLIPYFHHVENHDTYHPRTLEMYEEMRGTIERIEHMIPAEDQEGDDYETRKARKKEKKRLARRRWRTVYKELYPKLKELAEEDQKSGILRQTSLHILNAGGPALELLPEHLQEELVGHIRPLAEARMEKLAAQAQEAEKEFSKAELTNEEGLESALKDLDAIAKSMDGYNNLPVPVHDLSDELKEKLNEIFEQFKALQEAIMKAVKEMMEGLEDKVLDKFDGMMDTGKLPKHSDPKPSNKPGKDGTSGEKADDPAKKKLEKKRIEELRKQIEAQQEALSHQSTYERYYKEIQQVEEALYHRLYELFYPKRSRKRRLRSSGNRANIEAVFRFVSARRAGAREVNMDIWESPEKPDVRDYAVSIIVDLSGSMMGDTIEETLKAVIVVAEVLNRLGIKVEISGFGTIANSGKLNKKDASGGWGDQIITFKSFDDEYNDEVRQGTALMLGANGPSTPTADGVKNAAKSLEGVEAKDKFIVCLTDGAPDSRTNTTREIESAQNNGIGVIGLGIGAGTEKTASLFPAGEGGIRIDQLPDALADLIEAILTNPQLFR